MRTLYGVIAIVWSLISIAGYAAAPPNAPAGTTGLCKDGTYYSGTTKQGACRGHKGVKEWYGTAQAAHGAEPPTTTTQPPATNTPKSAANPPTSTPPVPTKSAGSRGTTGAGGAPGQVWVNVPTKVYHCSGTRWYGKTKQGEYMSEGEAKAKGFKPDHGKACS